MPIHSLFFETCDEANKAQKFVEQWIVLEDIYQSNDGESGLVEVRFFTERKISERNIGYIIGGTNPTTYSLNGEDY